MQKNVGSIDRAIRALVGIALLVGYFLDAVQGALGIIAVIVGVVLLATAALGWCPPYTLVGINTCSVKEKAQNS